MTLSLSLLSCCRNQPKDTSVVQVRVLILLPKPHDAFSGLILLSFSEACDTVKFPPPIGPLTFLVFFWYPGLCVSQ
jgi:hypothetical protein